MSKAAKQSILILIILVLACAGGAVFFALEKQKVEQSKNVLQEEFTKTTEQNKERQEQLTQSINGLKGQLDALNKEKQDIFGQLKQTESNLKDVSSQLVKAGEESDKWKRRIDSVQKERDDLINKMTDLNKRIQSQEKEFAKKDKELVKEIEERLSKEWEEKKVKSQEETKSSEVVKKGDADPKAFKAPASFSKGDESYDEAYWANLLQEKASLEIEINKIKEELMEKSVEVVELRQSNEQLQLEVSKLQHEKEKVEVEIQHKTKMLDSISLELARTRNEKKFVADRVEKLNDENGDLHQQLKKLVSVKNALEKSIVRVTREKEKVQGQLGQTESLIQSKIDEIWDIKDDLDRSIRSAKIGQDGVSSGGVELPPIVVSSSGMATSFNNETVTGLNGRVMSINEANNFVIVDIGENEGVRLGDRLSVYRDAQYVAQLEVIQVRKDICAADLKEQWTRVQVGDVIR